MAKKKEPLQKIIRSLLTGGLKTSIAFYSVEKDEVLTAFFADEAEYQKLLKIKSFVPSSEEELLNWVNRNIPVIEDDFDPTLPSENVSIPKNFATRPSEFGVEEYGTFTSFGEEKSTPEVMNKPGRRRGRG